MPAVQSLFVMPFSERLRLARLFRELSPLALGRRAQIPPRTIVRYEDGAIVPTLVTLVRLARALDVTADYLFGLVDIPFPSKRIEIGDRDSERLSDSEWELARKIIRMVEERDLSGDPIPVGRPRDGRRWRRYRLHL